MCLPLGLGLPKVFLQWTITGLTRQAIGIGSVSLVMLELWASAND